MGRPLKNPPKEPKLKTLIDDLGEAGCMMMWKGRRPFFRSGAGPKKAELWQVWAGAVDSTPRSRWLNFDPEMTRYPGSIEDTETKMLAILSGDRSEGLIAGDPREIIDETHGDDEGLTRQEAARLIYDHWRNDHAKLLGDALTELRRVREQRKQLYGTDPDAAAAWLDTIKANLPENSSVLEIDDTKPRLITDPEVRRRLFLRPVLWRNVCRGGYAERPLLRHKLMQDFEGFLDGSEDFIAALQIPVFWIGGRSGDGKSVLLMQLCHLVKQAHPSLPIIHFEEPDTLIDWIETSAPDREVSAELPLILAVVDDLHKVTDWERAQKVLEKAATEGAGFAIVTCGPNPERTLFTEQSLIQSCLAIHKCDSPKLTPQDVDAIAAHLGIGIDADEGPKPTLVERLFLTLAGEASIDNFARSLRERFNARLHREDLLDQLTAMAWLDLPLPRVLTSHDDAEWLEVLAGETQLHISVEGGDFYFGHPAIARPIFDALTRAGSLSLTTRIAQVLSQTVNNLTSSLDTTRTLRQIMTRLNADAEVDVKEVLDQIFKKANGARVKSAVIIFLIYHLTRNNQEIQRDWVSLGRTYRANASLEPQTRAFLARNLALAKNAEESDLRAALDLVSDPSVAPHLGKFLEGLTSKSCRAKGWTFKGIVPALTWVQRNSDQYMSQNVLAGFLSHYPNDTRIREAFVDLARSTHKPLSLTTMTAAAKYLEDEIQQELRTWLVKFLRRPAATDVFAPLLKKPGEKWYDLLQQHLSHADIGDASWQASIATLVPHVSTNEMAETVRQAAKAQLGAPAGDSGVGNLFVRIAEHCSDLEADEIVCDRLEFLWEPDSLAEYGGERQACFLLGAAWGRLAGSRDGFTHWAQQMFDFLTAIEREAIGQRLSNMRKKHRSGLRHSASLILRRFEHADLCAQPALAFHETFPEDDLSGMVVAQLVMLLGRRAEDVDPEVFSELQQREEELLASCWTCARDTKRSERWSRVMCTQALLETRWDTEADDVRELIWSFWYPDPQYGADHVLQSYLRDPRCQDAAFSFLLDRSVVRSRYDQLRANVVSRNMQMVFEKLNSGSLVPDDRGYLLNLLESGIGNWETNPTSAWFALQVRDVWPPEAEAAIWRGILRSALNGYSLREEDYRPQFDAWQVENRDQGCEDIIHEANSYVAK